MTRRIDSLLLWSAALAVAGVAIALVLQHVFEMAPCAWCTFQRLIFLIFAALAFAGWLLRRWRVPRVLLSAAAALTAIGGLAAALHQHFVAAQTQSCVFTFADRTLMKLGLDESLPWLFEPTASCSDANAPLLGVPFAFWSAALFVLLALAAAWVALARAPAGGRGRDR